MNTMIKCINCNTELPDDSDFCSKCGQRLVRSVDVNYFENPKTDVVVSEPKRQLSKKVVVSGIVAIVCVIIGVMVFKRLSTPYVEISNTIKGYTKRANISDFCDSAVPTDVSTDSASESFFRERVCAYYDYVEHDVQFSDDYVVVAVQSVYLLGSFTISEDADTNLWVGTLYAGQLQDIANECDLNKTVLLIYYNSDGEPLYTFTADKLAFDEHGDFVADLSNME